MDQSLDLKKQGGTANITGDVENGVGRIKSLFEAFPNGFKIPSPAQINLPAGPIPPWTRIIRTGLFQQGTHVFYSGEALADEVAAMNGLMSANAGCPGDEKQITPRA